MKVFSFRAECPPDATTFMAEANKQQVIIQITKMHADPGHSFPDRMVEICTVMDEDDNDPNINIETLRNVLRGMEDSHVMLETLRECPVEENTGGRDSSIE